eukprot:995354-Pyramimonas_sp.AAC.1
MIARGYADTASTLPAERGFFNEPSRQSWRQRKRTKPACFHIYKAPASPSKRSDAAVRARENKDDTPWAISAKLWEAQTQIKKLEQEMQQRKQ